MRDRSQRFYEITFRTGPEPLFTWHWTAGDDDEAVALGEEAHETFRRAFAIDVPHDGPSMRRTGTHTCSYETWTVARRLIAGHGHGEGEAALIEARARDAANAVALAEGARRALAGEHGNLECYASIAQDDEAMARCHLATMAMGAGAQTDFRHPDAVGKVFNIALLKLRSAVRPDWSDPWILERIHCDRPASATLRATWPERLDGIVQGQSRRAAEALRALGAPGIAEEVLALAAKGG